MFHIFKIIKVKIKFIYFQVSVITSRLLNVFAKCNEFKFSI